MTTTTIARFLAGRLTATTLVSLVALTMIFSSGCKRGSSKGSNPFDLGKAEGGTLVVDFATLQDFLDHPTVQLLLANMPRHEGNTPPNVEGTYDAFGGIVDTTIPGSEIGDSVISHFCFGTPAGGVLEVNILDPTVVENALMSFIEGNGDFFTVFTVFRSLQPHPDGGNCEIIEVNIFSGKLEADGTLSDLHIGIGIVGLLGNCRPLRIDDAQISRLAGENVGPACPAPPVGPADPDKVQIVVRNFLVNDIQMFDDPSANANAAVIVPALGEGSFETDPLPLLDFESIQPSAGLDDNGNDLLMGEIVAGEFPVNPGDVAGSVVTYDILNLVGDDYFFAPRPLNTTNVDIYSVVNAGIPTLDFFPYEAPFGQGLDCLCVLPPSNDAYDIGYYTYDAIGIMTRDDASIRFFNADTDTQISQAFGPFGIDGEVGTDGASGSVVIDAGAGAFIP